MFSHPSAGVDRMPSAPTSRNRTRLGRTNPSRRRFMQGAAAAAAALALPRRIPLLAAGSNEKLNVASIGVTGQGASDLDGVAAHSDLVQIVALCDVDEVNMGKAVERYPSARRFSD